MTNPNALLLLTASMLTTACGDWTASLSVADAQHDESAGLVGKARGLNTLVPVDSEILELRPAPNPERNAYFGDLHVHTANSFDAYQFGTLADAGDAYRYARGESLHHPSGYEVQLQTPLDFYAVTDHAMFMGVSQAAADTGTKISQLALARPLHDINAPDNMGDSSLLSRGQAFAEFIPALLTAILDGEVDPSMTDKITRAAWRDNIDAAEAAYVAGSFTSFIGYEYTSSSDDRGNLHRNVIFKGSDRIPAIPFSRLNSQNPEGLWDWMDELRAQGIESLAIPHNSNGSNGKMFMGEDWSGRPIDQDYTGQRMRNEPLVEITQVKGTSETHPLLSTRDEWADFEIVPFRVATKLPSEPAGSYVRDAWLRGLAIRQSGGGNPYQFGVIGSSDTHTGATSATESDFFSKAGLIDGKPQLRGSVALSRLYGTVLKLTSPELVTRVDGKDYLASSAFETWSASGLAGIWAEENTRESLFDALRRRETFATSGPRIKLRFFAGFDYAPDLLQQQGAMQHAYAGGVPMGGELQGQDDRVPTFLAWAIADANGAPLQRLQIIKGTLVGGNTQERVYDIACSDGAAVDPGTHRCPDNGARVDPEDCSISRDVGDGELKTRWQDPDFRPEVAAFYYLRALENPVCRWSSWDALRAGAEPRSDLPRTIQERAWSSPIWYVPESE